MNTAKVTEPWVEYVVVRNFGKYTHKPVGRGSMNQQQFSIHHAVLKRPVTSAAIEISCEQHCFVNAEQTSRKLVISWKEFWKE